MYFNKETLWKFRQQVVVNSLFLSDYTNDFVSQNTAYDICDAYFSWVDEELEECSSEDDFFKIFKERYDNAEMWWEWYENSGIEWVLKEGNAFITVEDMKKDLEDTCKEYREFMGI